MADGTDRQAALIGGRSVATADGWPVMDPMTEEKIRTIGVVPPQRFRETIDAAAAAMARAPAAHERAAALHRLADALQARAETLVDLPAAEAGKPVTLARGEVDRACSTLRMSAAEARKHEVPTFRADQMPYGGINASGNTREGPAYAVREMTHERLISLQPA